MIKLEVAKFGAFLIVLMISSVNETVSRTGSLHEFTNGRPEASRETILVAEAGPTCPRGYAQCGNGCCPA